MLVHLHLNREAYALYKQLSQECTALLMLGIDLDQRFVRRLNVSKTQGISRSQDNQQTYQHMRMTWLEGNVSTQMLFNGSYNGTSILVASSKTFAKAAYSTPSQVESMQKAGMLKPQVGQDKMNGRNMSPHLDIIFADPRNIGCKGVPLLSLVHISYVPDAKCWSGQEPSIPVLSMNRCPKDTLTRKPHVSPLCRSAESLKLLLHASFRGHYFVLTWQTFWAACVLPGAIC